MIKTTEDVLAWIRANVVGDPEKLAILWAVYQMADFVAHDSLEEFENALLETSSFNISDVAQFVELVDEEGEPSIVESLLREFFFGKGVG